MKRGNLYRVIVITIAFVMLGCAILIPLGSDANNRIWLFIVGGILLLGYIGSMVWSLVYYGRKENRKETSD